MSVGLTVLALQATIWLVVLAMRDVMQHECNTFPLRRVGFTWRVMNQIQGIIYVALYGDSTLGLYDEALEPIYCDLLRICGLGIHWLDGLTSKTSTVHIKNASGDQSCVVPFESTDLVWFDINNLIVCLLYCKRQEFLVAAHVSNELKWKTIGTIEVLVCIYSYTIQLQQTYTFFTWQALEEPDSRANPFSPGRTDVAQHREYGLRLRWVLSVKKNSFQE